jgi:organic hydroperoxide reductase OsmC/OhrA
MGKNEEGKIAMLRVNFKPRDHFFRNRKAIKRNYSQIHDLAHDSCFIASSVKTEIEIITN